jgi:hypothetical protein
MRNMAKRNIHNNVPVIIPVNQKMHKMSFAVSFLFFSILCHQTFSAAIPFSTSEPGSQETSTFRGNSFFVKFSLHKHHFLVNINVYFVKNKNG